MRKSLANIETLTTLPWSGGQGGRKMRKSLANIETLTTFLWSGGQDVPWIANGSEFESAPH
ncbi:hypothetical protein F2Q69_00023395 [Brassica cretica]|uniref:Uncharacterized protein n=1 Tax=Brassica cretica TaxID=69181 RepID=A0A8S9QI71_BRACR|nr:hypothetical protein F2Q69_00023395 [Brassica cretica]